MNVWEKMPVKPGGTGLWQHLKSELKDSTSFQPGVGIWAQIGVQPGGLWSDARDETVVLQRSVKPEESVWQSAGDETIILEPEEQVNIWDVSEDSMDDTILDGEVPLALWDEVDGETLMLAQSQERIWTAPKIRDMTKYKPMRAVGWALKKLETSRGDEYWVLKNLRTDKYLRLNEQQVFSWNQMDGSRSVQDLAVANFMRYQVLSIEGLMGFIGQLYANGFLITEGVNVYAVSGMQLATRGFRYWIQRIVGFLLQSEISIKSVDKYYAKMYKWGGWVLYKWPIMLIIFLVSIAGVPAYFYITQSGGLSFIQGSGGSIGVGLIGLLIGQIFAIFTHESAHALTTKHYGRTVRRGGMGLYFGMLTFFMDTTDIWMEPRRPRLAVTWAGPISGFFLGGVAALSLLVGTTTTWAGFAYQFASFCIGMSILNLNPLLKLDGYYILMDWLEMPMLRERAMSFVREDLWPKIRKRESFDREAKIFTVFGILALLWTGLVIVSLINLFGSAIYGFLENFLGVYTVWIITAVVGILILYYGYGFVKNLIKSRKMKVKQAEEGSAD